MTELGRNHCDGVRPVRVLQVLSVTALGGTELMVSALVQRLDRTRVSSLVAALDASGPLDGLLGAQGFPVCNVDVGAGYVQAFRRLRKHLRSGAFDVIHLYGLRASLLGRLAAHSLRPRPRVVNGIRGFHVTPDGVETWRTRLSIALERAASPLVDVYAANSTGAVEFLSSRGLPREKFVYIPNGLDVSLWDVPRRDLHEVPRVVCVANLKPVKRHSDLLAALAILKRRAVRFDAVLVGDGPLRAQLLDTIREVALTDCVSLAGRLAPDAVRDVLATSDVFVLASGCEGMPGSVMEAMAAGLPVVGTDAPGIRELVVDGGTGCLVPVGDAPALADRLEWLLANEIARAEMGTAGRTLIQREYSIERMVARHEALYTTLAAGAIA